MLRERRKDLVEVSVKYTLLSQQGEPVLAPFIVTANCEEEESWMENHIDSFFHAGDYVEAFSLETKPQNVIDTIPGVAVYRVSDIFDMQYFSKGVPELTGYTPEEYRRVIKGRDFSNAFLGRHTDGKCGNCVIFTGNIMLPLISNSVCTTGVGIGYGSAYRQRS